MPFQSYKQETYLKKNVPKVYKKWKKKYGTKIRGDSTKRGAVRKNKKA